MIVEEARASAHRLLQQLNRNVDTLVEERIGAVLARHTDGLTLREITRNTGFSRQSILEALKALEDGGAIAREERKHNGAGRPANVYKPI
jgi:predicted ArsR family transcriptional regulator